MNLRLLGNRDFFLLWQGSLMSLVGSQLHLIASMIWLKSDQELEVYIPAYLICASVPIALTGIFGGKLADRRAGAGLLAASDFMSGFLAVLLGILFFADLRLSGLQLVLILMVLTSLISVFQGIHKPASSKMVKTLVSEKDLCDGHSWIELSNRLSAPLGQWLGGWLMMLTGPGILFLSNGVSFIASGVSELFIRGGRNKTSDSSTDKQKSAVIKTEMPSVKDILSMSAIRRVLILTFAVNLLLAPVPAIIPFLATDFLNLSGAWIANLFSLLGTGLFLGVLLAPRLWTLGQKIPGVESGLSFLFSLAFILLYAGSRIEFVGTGLILLGMTACILGIHFTTRLQSLLEPEYTGKIMGLVVSMAYFCTPVSLVLVSLVMNILQSGALKLFFLPGCVLGILYGFFNLLEGQSSPEPSRSGDIR